MTERGVIFEAQDISKVFGPTIAVNRVNLKVYQGEIHGLVGENGSGKSTLSAVVAGIHRPDGGTMLFKGRPYAPYSMVDGARHGVGMIIQEVGTVPGLTIAQNVFLGQEGQFKRFGLISKGSMMAAAQEAMDNIGLTGVKPSTYIDALDMESRKLVEVAAVLHNKPDLLIIDETTTALSQKGRTMLYRIMNDMKEQGKSVLFISHDLEEVLEYCDTVTILRDGSLVNTVRSSEVTVDHLKQLMVGRDLGGHYYRQDRVCHFEPEVVLEITDLTTGRGPLKHFSAKLHKGEILGIAGLSHCGMHELGRALIGEEPIIQGSVLHRPSGREIKCVRDALDLGMGYVSKNRDAEALVMSASVKDNIVSAGYDRVNSFWGLIRPSSEVQYAEHLVDQLRIKCSSIEQEVQYLSGGNKQKVVFAKWLGRGSQILVLDCPTRGVDVGVKASMYALMEEMKEKGHSIIMISEEMPELIGMCDRIIVLKDGSISGILHRDKDFTEQAVIQLMI